MEKTPIGKLKIKSYIAIALLFIVLLAMGMATYSWYTVSTAPQVRAVETYMAVIDPMLNIARATNEFTEPEEVGNEDSSPLDPEKQDTTWGTKISSYGNNTLQVEYPATLVMEEDDLDGILSSVEFGPDGRIDKTEELHPGEMGEEVDARGYKMNGVRYYKSSDGRVCAIGLGVWVRINQEDKDLVIALSDVKFTDAAGNPIIIKDCANVSVKVVEEDRIVPTGYSYEKGIHFGTIYSHEDGYPFPANKPVLVEIIVYAEGETAGNDEENEIEKKGLIAADVDEGFCMNIERITFYDNINFDETRDDTSTETEPESTENETSGS